MDERKEGARSRSGSRSSPPVDKRATLQSVHRAIAVLDILARGTEPTSLANLAHQLGFDRTIARRIVRTLQSEGLIEEVPGSRYVLGARTIMFGNAYRESLSLRSAALPYMADFVRALGDQQLMVSLSIIAGNRLVLVDQIWNPNLSLDLLFKAGSHFPVDQTASGRALLAYMSPDELTGILGRKRATELGETLAKIRANNGVEFNTRSDLSGQAAIAAVIFPRTAQQRSALLLSGIGIENDLAPGSALAMRVRRYADRIGELV